MQILTKITRKDFDSIMDPSPDDIIEKLKESGLEGRGGAGFPTWAKWDYTKKSEGSRALVCNADEGEPGTFKDRFIIENNLETLLQGIDIGGKVLDAECFIYLRHEYNHLKDKIEEKAEELGFDIEVVMGAGAYICGEETALLNSMEGKRGTPRLKPPYPAQKGFEGRPTCVNNVETLANVPILLSKKKWNKNKRLFSISGDVEEPGVYEKELGSKLKDVLKVAKPRNPRAVLVGYSGGAAPFEKLKNLKVSEENFKKNRISLGTGSMIVLNRERSMVSALKNVSRFFVHESCGRCIPCREGGFKMFKLIEKIEQGDGNERDLRELKELAEYIDISSCGLGQGYGFAVRSIVKNFRKEFEKCT